MMEAERRVFSGDWLPADAEWLAWLDDLFVDVPLSGMIDQGMSMEKARRLVDLLALTKKATALSPAPIRQERETP